MNARCQGCAPAATYSNAYALVCAGPLDTPSAARSYFCDKLETVKTPKPTSVTLPLPKRNVDMDRPALRFLERIANAPDRGTAGVIRWTRDEIHERGVIARCPGPPSF